MTGNWPKGLDCNYRLCLQCMYMAQRKTKTISVPPELAKQLDRFSDENWSAIACQAFETRLNQIKVMNVKDKNERAVARLRASKESGTNELYAKGELAGAEFAMDKAEYVQLERLERWYAAYGRDFRQVLTTNQVGIHDVIEALEGKDGDPKGVYDEWTEEYGPDIEDISWIDGFIGGAVNKFAEIKDKL